jgi:hypothetical protein
MKKSFFKNGAIEQKRTVYIKFIISLFLNIKLARKASRAALIIEE